MFLRLLILFTAIPLIELYLFLTIGDAIGLAATIGIVIFTGVLGAWLAKVQGLRALQRYQQAIAEHRLPHKEVVDGLMILLAGAFLITPGFLTDTCGFLLLIPPARAVVRKLLSAYLAKRITINGQPLSEVGKQAPHQEGRGHPAPGSTTRTTSGKVIIEAESEVIEE